MTPSGPRRVIDCLVNVHFGETETQPEFMKRVRDDYFKGPKSMFDPVELPELLDEMDQHGVRKAILMDNLAKPSVTARKFVEARPDRFALAMGASTCCARWRRCASWPPRWPTFRSPIPCGAQLLGRRAIPAE